MLSRAGGVIPCLFSFTGSLCSALQMNLTPTTPPAWSLNARRTIAVVVAVAVRVVTRQQVAGIEKARRGGVCACVCGGGWGGIQTAEFGFVGRLLPCSCRERQEGWQQDKGSQQIENEVANDTLNPLHMFDDTHARTLMHFYTIS